jgi:hypothetical protein
MRECILFRRPRSGCRSDRFVLDVLGSIVHPSEVLLLLLVPTSHAQTQIKCAKNIVRYRLSVSCEPDGEGSIINVWVDRLRAFLWLTFWIACSVLAGREMSEPAGVFLIIGVSTAAWLGIVFLLGDYLIKKKIVDILDNRL